MVIYKIFINIFFLFIIVLSLVIWGYLKITAKQPELVKIVIDERQDVWAEIADSSEEHRRGLAGRDELPEDRGMLFVFPGRSRQNFWMKGMKFSLDIIWIDDGQIIAIDKSADFRNQEKLYSPGRPIDYVLEVQAGWSDQNGVKAGDKVKIMDLPENS